MNIRNIILEQISKQSALTFTNKTISKGEFTLTFFFDNVEIGFINYFFYNKPISLYMEKNEKELYIDFITVHEKFKGNKYSSQMLTILKQIAKKMGATIITLRSDYGMGSSVKARKENGHLDKIYLQNGFQYTFDLDDIDDERSPGAMYYKLI